MATILLIIIYIAFIGLGIPDSLFGTAWPLIYTEFDLPIAYASSVTMLISGGTVVSSLFSAQIIKRLGTGRITAISTLVTAAALLGFSYAGNMVWLCLFAIPLGLGAGAIDTALNNYVALNYKAIHMNFLHCFYGIGITLSPYLMSIAFEKDASWRGGYRIVFYFQLAIAVVTLLALPLWGKVKAAHDESGQEEIHTFALGELLNISSVRSVVLIFLASCAIEYTCGIWGSTFLVGAKGMTAAVAAKTITFYYLGIAIGRFLSGVFAYKISSWRLIKTGQFITFAAILVLLLPLPSAISGAGLFLVGLGNGTLYPNLIHLTPQNFGKRMSQSVMGVQMAASYVGTMLMPPFFGLLAQNISISLFPYYLLGLFGVMFAATYLLQRNVSVQSA
ncbi:MAG: MFS transporter [Lachnospiraceae bacterium]